MPDRIISTGAEVDLDAIVAKIVAAYHPTKIYLFGSRARGTARPDSDVDLLVIYDGQESVREVKIGIRMLLYPPPCSFDLVVLPSSTFEKQKTWMNYIAREAYLYGRVLYE